MSYNSYDDGYNTAEKRTRERLIGEFLPHLDWALNELYPTHFNNEEYQDAVSFYKKWERRK